jgi:ribokinase
MTAAHQGPVKALVVGSLVMDLSFRIPKRPEPGEVIIAEEFGTYRGGKGYNQAVALARLGAQVTMIGAVGDDANGHDFLAALTRESVDASRMVVLEGVQTSVAVPMVTPDGDVAFVHAPAANRHLRPEHVRELLDYDVVLLQGEVPAETSIAAARALRAQGGIVMLNPAPVHDVTAGLLAVADFVTPNEVEVYALLGRKQRRGDDPTLLARALADTDRTAVITLGARGAAFAHQEEAGMVPAPAIDAIDATAAGDSFCAALAIATVEGLPIEAAVRFACAAGAHAATVRGAEPGLPTREQVELLLGQ